MGVSALYMSFMEAFSERCPSAEILVFDYGEGLREVGEPGIRNRVLRYGMRTGKRVYRFDNIFNLSLFSKAGRLGRISEAVALIDSCDAIADVSAGDSFSDIYGQRRFRRMLLQKRVAMRRGVPMLFLPQTYGPFSARNRAKTVQVLTAAREVWSRDAESMQVLASILGERMDNAKFRLGLDMAFGLSPQVPEHLEVGLKNFLESAKIVVGINVSGLIWKDEENAFGLLATYQEVLERALKELLSNAEVSVLLVPHVLDPPGSVESDIGASEELVARIGHQSVDRTYIVPTSYSAGELKWIISQCDWFCGTRMHSTIAGLSSAVPTTSVVYSDKAFGVFDQCGQAHQIIDPRKLTTDTVVSRLLDSFGERSITQRQLRETMPNVLAEQGRQMDCIVASLVA